MQYSGVDVPFDNMAATRPSTARWAPTSQCPSPSASTRSTTTVPARTPARRRAPSTAPSSMGDDLVAFSVTGHIAPPPPPQTPSPSSPPPRRPTRCRRSASSSTARPTRAHRGRLPGRGVSRRRRRLHLSGLLRLRFAEHLLRPAHVHPNNANIGDDSCEHANDGVCNDGGPGSVFYTDPDGNTVSLCGFATDLTDCPQRTLTTLGPLSYAAGRPTRCAKPPPSHRRSHRRRRRRRSPRATTRARQHRDRRPPCAPTAARAPSSIKRRRFRVRLRHAVYRVRHAPSGQRRWLRTATRDRATASARTRSGRARWLRHRHDRLWRAPPHAVHARHLPVCSDRKPAQAAECGRALHILAASAASAAALPGHGHEPGVRRRTVPTAAAPAATAVAAAAATQPAAAHRSRLLRVLVHRLGLRTRTRTGRASAWSRRAFPRRTRVSTLPRRPSSAAPRRRRVR